MAIRTGYAFAHLFALFSAMYWTAAAAQRQPSPAVQTELGALNGSHPTYYRVSAKLFRTDAKDEAVFVFYLGQLRYRAHLTARPALPPDGEPALFASLSQVVGLPINEYAFGDLPILVETIDAVLDYDQHALSRQPLRMMCV